MNNTLQRVLYAALLFVATTTTHGSEAAAGKDELYAGKQYSSAFAMPQDDPRLPNVLLEFRQDEIDGIQKAHPWADKVAEVLRPILECPEIHVPYVEERSDC